MDNHFLQGDCLPWELPSLPWGVTVPPTKKGGGEGGGKLALCQSGRQGRGLLDLSPPPDPRSPVDSTGHFSLTCPLRGTPSPGVSFRKMNPGDLFLAACPFAVGLLFVRETPVSSRRMIPTSVHLLQSQEQRIFLVLVLPLTRSKTLGKSLALLEVNFPHW